MSGVNSVPCTEKQGGGKKPVSQFQMELISNENCNGMGWKSPLDLGRVTLRTVSKHHWTFLQLVSRWLLAPDSLVRADRWVISKTRSSTDSYKLWKGRFTWKSKPEWPPGIFETLHWSKLWILVVVSNIQRAWSEVMRGGNYKVVGILAQTQAHGTCITPRHCNSLDTL